MCPSNNCTYSFHMYPLVQACITSMTHFYSLVNNQSYRFIRRNNFICLFIQSETNPKTCVNPTRPETFQTHNINKIQIFKNYNLKLCMYIHITIHITIRKEEKIKSKF